MDQATQTYIDKQIREHIHDGNFSQRVNFLDIFGNVDSFNIMSNTIATTGNTDMYFMAPYPGNISQIDFTSLVALAASNTNYITWSVQNITTGAATMLSNTPTDVNTTKVTGGSAITANTLRNLPLVVGQSLTTVREGDWIRIRAAVTGTLANTVTFPTYLIQLTIK
jgi:hypothetical protein